MADRAEPGLDIVSRGLVKREECQGDRLTAVNLFKRSEKYYSKVNWNVFFSANAKSSFGGEPEVYTLCLKKRDPDIIDCNSKKD